MSISKRLYRSRDDRIFAGIFGGLGQYFDLDPVLLRLAWVVIFIITGGVPGLLIYIIAIFIVPLEPEKRENQESVVHEMKAETKTEDSVKSSSQAEPEQSPTTSTETIRRDNMW